MHHHRALSLAAALFVMPFAAGCVAGGEESDEVDLAMDEVGMEAQVDSTNGPLRCWHNPAAPYYGILVCRYSLPDAQGDSKWRYNYGQTPSPYSWYSSGNEVSWGNCTDPGGNSPSFWIYVEGKTTTDTFHSYVLVPCK